MRYTCKLKIPSVKQELSNEATSKKAAQTIVAWSYVDLLIKKGLVNESELPSRPTSQPKDTFTPKNGREIINCYLINLKSITN